MSGAALNEEHSTYSPELVQKPGYRICTRCVMDTSVPNIRFATDGHCHYCDMHDEMEKQYPLGEEGKNRLQKLVAEVKAAGKGKTYDVVCGISGGRDSTYILYMAAKILGLRVLAVHFDNGWNSEIAVTNIQNACRKLNIDLETVVADWEEFKDVLRSFLKASTSDVDIPTDVAIHAVLHKVAAKENIGYIFNGHCFRTEGIAPLDWTYMDGRYIASVQKKFGRMPLKDFHNFYLKDFVYYSFIKKVKVVPLLNFMTYRHAEVGPLLEKELGWTYYGGHHHESYYTRFIQSYLLPKKFNLDRRRTELSALIRSGQKTRAEAVEYLANQAYEYDEQLIQYAANKLGFSAAEFKDIIALPPKSFRDYPTYYPLIRALSWPIQLAARMGILPRLLYLKFLG